MNSDGTPWPRMLVGNVAVDLVDRDHALSLILDSVSASHPLAVLSANLDHIHHFADEPSWINRTPAVSVNEMTGGLRWLTLLDGAPLVRTANALSGRNWPKLSSGDLINPILEAAGTRRDAGGIPRRRSRTHTADCVSGRRTVSRHPPRGHLGAPRGGN